MRIFIRLPKLIWLYLSIGFFVLSLLYCSCKKTDWYQQPDSSSSFFATAADNPKVLHVIKLLKAENQRTGFVNKVPANCGTPIWDKIIVRKNNNGTASFGAAQQQGDILIPLSLNQEHVNAVLLAHPNGNGFTIRCYTKEYLYAICHAADKNVLLAENVLLLFMIMENMVSGMQDFYHIPNDLFPHNKLHPLTDTTKMISIAPLSPKPGNQGNNIEDPNCIVVQSGVCNCVGGGCDWRSGCGYCSALYCTIPDGGGGTGGGGSWPPPDGPTSPGGTGGGNGGGNGGSGGGGGSPGCTEPFYFIEPCDDDPPTSPTPPAPPLPADTILDPCSDADFLQTSASFKSYMQELKDSTNSNREFGYMLFKDNIGVFGNTPLGLIAGPPNKLSLGDFKNYYKLDAILHSHFNTGTDSTRGLSVFSPDDLWTMCHMFINSSNINSPATFTMGLVTKNNTQYLLKIENLTKFRIWAGELVQGSFKLFKYLYQDNLKILPTNSNAENEKGFLKFIQGSNNASGLKLFRGNSSFTQWQPIVYDKNTGTVVNAPCP